MIILWQTHADSGVLITLEYDLSQWISSRIVPTCSKFRSIVAMVSAPTGRGRKVGLLCEFPVQGANSGHGLAGYLVECT